MRINQILIGASEGDAITSMALELGQALQRVAPSGTYAVHRSTSMEDDVEPINRFPVGGRRDDVIVYHASFGDPDVTRFLLSRPERLVLVYHNITPFEFLLPVAPETAARLSWGRQELELLRNRVDLAVAVSSYNASDLATLGYDDVKVVSPGLRPRRLLHYRHNRALERHIRSQLTVPIILAVAQLLPHKRIDLLLEAFHILRTHLGHNAALVIVGAAPHHAYRRALVQLASRLTNDMLWFTGRIDDHDLATYFRMAALFVTASEHEGLCLPPLEAMAFGVPVIARACAALPETIGEGGLLLPADAGPALFAEAIAEVLTQDSLQERLIAAGRDRVDTVSEIDGTADFLALLQDVI
jgi:glycosyltransferase involved in cell wall biosynthesis